LITTDGGLVSIDTDPNVVIVDNISCIFALFLSSDLQTFIGSKAIEEEVMKEEENLMALSEDGCLQQLNLKYKNNAI
jgi:hypothetical protein